MKNTTTSAVEVQPYRDCPINVLPVAIRELTEGISAANGTYHAMSAVSALIVAGGLMGKGPRLKQGYNTNYPNLYAAAVADAGSGKSAINIVTAPAHRLSKERCEQWETVDKPAEYQWLKQLERAEETLLKGDKLTDTIFQQWLSEITKGEQRSADPRKPSPELKAIAVEIARVKRELKGKRCLILQDCTSQAGIPIQAANGQCIMIADSEGRDFIKNLMGRNSRDGMGDEQWANKCWNNDPIETDRVTSGSTSMEEPCMSITVGIQPALFEEFTSSKKLKDSGIASRLMPYNVPDKFAKSVDKTELPEAVFRAWDSTCERIYNAYRFGVSYDITLTPEADRLHKEFADYIVERRKEGKSALKELPSRWAQQALRIALIFHVVDLMEEAPKHQISVETMARAIQWQRWCMEAQLDYYHFEASKKVDEQEGKVMKLIANQNWVNIGITHKQLVDNNIEKDPTIAKTILERLAAEGKIYRLEYKSTNGRGMVCKYFKHKRQ